MNNIDRQKHYKNNSVDLYSKQPLLLFYHSKRPVLTVIDPPRVCMGIGLHMCVYTGEVAYNSCNGATTGLNEQSNYYIRRTA